MSESQTLNISSVRVPFFSDSQSVFKSKRTGDGPSWYPLLEDGVGNQPSCSDCSIKFENEARRLPKVPSTSQDSMVTSNLPSWFQQYKEENKRQTSNDKVIKELIGIISSLMYHI